MPTITDETVNHLADLQDICWQNSQDKGFHDNEPTDPEQLAIYNGNRLMLIVSEAVEAHEEIRNGRSAHEAYYTLPGIAGTYPSTKAARAGQHGSSVNPKPEGVPSEIADIVIRCFDFAGSNGFNLGAIIQEKLAYNSTRPHMHGKKF